MLLFRLLIVLVLIVLFLPVGRDPAGQQASGVDALSALGAAGAAVSDVRSFCDRQPQACAVGVRTLQAVEDHARTGARTIQALIAEQSGGETAAPEPDTNTAAPATPGRGDGVSLAGMLSRLAGANMAGAPSPTPPPPSADVAVDTLRPADRQPAWQKPDVKPGRG